jgi:Uma2 family endonuclease
LIQNPILYQIRLIAPNKISLGIFPISFPPLCPDFVIELRSRTNKLKPLQEKMQEYLACGLRLGWLINPQDNQVEIYRPGQSVEIVTIPVELSGEEVLQRFTLQLTNL